MRIKATKKLAYFCIITSIGLCGLTACNSDSDSKAGDKTTDSSMATAGPSDSTTKDSTATVAKSPKKRRKASIVLPSASTDKIMKDKEGVYNRAEVMPEYPGGQNALAAYINDHINDGQTAIDDNTTGTLRVTFVVDENGKVTDVHTTGDKKLGNGLDDQTVKVISNMPSWTPGKVKGKDVKTRLVLPIAFEVE